MPWLILECVLGCQFRELLGFLSIELLPPLVECHLGYKHDALSKRPNGNKLQVIYVPTTRLFTHQLRQIGEHSALHRKRLIIHDVPVENVKFVVSHSILSPRGGQVQREREREQSDSE